MRKFGFLAAFAFAVLAGASVWLGGLNQDEGWYLYAAQMLRDGHLPYRDFFFTQGPLLPNVYALLAPLWEGGGLLAARILTCAIGLVGILFAVVSARQLAPPGSRDVAGLIAFLLLGNNLYHVYYLSIPKTYALAALFSGAGYCLLAIALTDPQVRFRRALAVLSGLTMALSTGARISLGALLAVCGFALLFNFRRYRWMFLWFGIGGVAGLVSAYGPFVADVGALEGLLAAQRYHAARAGFDPVFTVGSVSRLVRWYFPVFVLLGLAAYRRFVAGRDESGDDRRFALSLFAWGFAAVFAVQMLAPFPYEDYQVPVMGLLAVVAAVACAKWTEEAGLAKGRSFFVLLALGLTWAGSFGSPLLEKWTTDGQDRFWTLKKEKSELAQLRETAAIVEALDPGGRELLTQDTYLAVETGRRVPGGLEMGPFSILSDGEWRALLESAPCRIAALSGYTFAIDPPSCVERPLDRQLEYWTILRKRYEIVMREKRFGQNATPLIILKRREEGGTDGK